MQRYNGSRENIYAIRQSGSYVTERAERERTGIAGTGPSAIIAQALIGRRTRPSGKTWPQRENDPRLFGVFICEHVEGNDKERLS